MDMKLESTSDLYLILAVLVPGFIYNGVLSHFVPLHQNSEKALVLLRLLTATAFNYALCSPLIYLLATNALFPHRAVPQGVTWFLIDSVRGSGGNSKLVRVWTGVVIGSAV